MVFGCLTFDMLGEAGAKPCFGSSRQLFPDFFWGGRAVKDGWFPQEIAMKSHHIYISIIISIYINISFKILEASTRWWRRFQGCWWGAGDVLRLPRWYRDVSHLLLDPKGSVSSQLRQRYGFHVESIWNYERNTYDSLCGVFPNIWSLCYI